jgi:Cytochrome P450
MQSINASEVTTRDHFAFGAGRHVCPGYHIAERSLAVAIMRLLWAFKIEAMPGTESPLDPLTFEGQMMRGTPEKRMPVTLRLLDDKKDVINRHFKEFDDLRPELVWQCLLVSRAHD